MTSSSLRLSTPERDPRRQEAHEKTPIVVICDADSSSLSCVYRGRRTLCAPLASVLGYFVEQLKSNRHPLAQKLTKKAIPSSCERSTCGISLLQGAPPSIVHPRAKCAPCGVPVTLVNIVFFSSTAPLYAVPASPMIYTSRWRVALTSFRLEATRLT